MTLISSSPGALFRQALSSETPLQIVGTINANHALIAQKAGFRAIYTSGGGVSAGSLGLPDLGIITLHDVLTDVRRITRVCDVPLVVDVDTGFSSIGRTIKSLIKIGAAGCHIEDQVSAKRCGHLPGKRLVSTDKMVERIKAATDAMTDENFFLIARTDALGPEGFDAAVERACVYVRAGADGIFLEAADDLATYKKFTQIVQAPLLANMTEFGKTPLFTVDQLHSAGVAMALYPLSAFRAMNRAAQSVYHAIRRDGHQQNVTEMMQTREELYECIGYYDFENKPDGLSDLKD